MEFLHLTGYLSLCCISPLIDYELACGRVDMYSIKPLKALGKGRYLQLAIAPPHAVVCCLAPTSSPYEVYLRFSNLFCSLVSSDNVSGIRIFRIF